MSADPPPGPPPEPPRDPPLTYERCLLAMFAAAAAGGLVMALSVWAPGVFSARGGATSPVAYLSALLGTAAVAAIIFIGAIGVVGGPLWWAAHRLRWRNAGGAALVGALLGAATLGVWYFGERARIPWEIVGGLSLGGAVAGWVLFRVAYGGPGRISG